MIRLEETFKNNRSDGFAVIHTVLYPDLSGSGAYKHTVILVTPKYNDARRVLKSLESSGVDWSQSHTASTHKAMRAAIIVATSDGNVTTADL